MNDFQKDSEAPFDVPTASTDVLATRSESSTGPQSSQKSLVNFFFELGMLKKTRRSGYKFLGSGGESVADHSFRTALIGYTLARLVPGVDLLKVISLCLFHDVPESRMGDLNYVNKKYVKPDEGRAVADLAATLPFGDEYRALMEEYRESRTLEARLVHDADQLDLICELKEQQDLGNPYACKWIHFALKRLQTETARTLADEILRTDSTAWWFEGRDHWWTSSHHEDD